MSYCYIKPYAYAILISSLRWSNWVRKCTLDAPSIVTPKAPGLVYFSKLSNMLELNYQGSNSFRLAIFLHNFFSFGEIWVSKTIWLFCCTSDGLFQENKARLVSCGHRVVKYISSGWIDPWFDAELRILWHYWMSSPERAISSAKTLSSAKSNSISLWHMKVQFMTFTF